MRFLLATLLLVAGCTVERPPETTPLDGQDAGEEVEFYSAGSVADDLPFSPAVRVGDIVFLSGQIGNVPGTLELVEGGLEAETRQTMENIRMTLESIGLSLENVVKCTVMIEDINLWGDFNEVYVEFFPGSKPARSAFGADGLALGAAVEVECIAHASPVG